ncbi:MAG: DUF4325 domain-containing protein [Bacteroidetes bacterium]|nr:DUF4325 domain-containing protein [Bacteroidota bacterium]
MKFTKEIINTIKEFIVENIEDHPNNIASVVIEHFGITKPTVSKYINELIVDDSIVRTGKGRYPKYQLKKAVFEIKKIISDSLEEDVIWREEISFKIKHLPKNIRSICQYGFTEMVNNVIDHSEGKQLTITVSISANNVEFMIKDDGIGIFNKIQKDLNLDDPKHAILELAKGKFTSDPENHTGEGIFFSSRMFDSFVIVSRELRFVGNTASRDWLFEDCKLDNKGTLVFMKISKTSTLDMESIFNEYSDPDKVPGFHRTVIPVKLMEYEGESLISRSQAKRLIKRFDHFLEVILDFEGVKFIGQAFADQIFRVFVNAHQKVKLIAINTIDEVQNMINYVKSNKVT